MNNQVRIENMDDLKSRIRLLELECKEKEEYLKYHSEELTESIKPSAIIRNALANSLSVTGPLSKHTISRNILGLIAGTVIKRIWSRKKK